MHHRLVKKLNILLLIFSVLLWIKHNYLLRIVRLFLALLLQIIRNAEIRRKRGVIFILPNR